MNAVIPKIYQNPRCALLDHPMDAQYGDDGDDHHGWCDHDPMIRAESRESVNSFGYYDDSHGGTRSV